MAAKRGYFALRNQSFAIALLMSGLVAGLLWARQPASPEGPPTELDPGTAAYFEKYIRPAFEKQCLSCHNANSEVSKLDLSTREGLLKGGKSGPAVVEGDPGASLLYQLVAHEAEPRMPIGADKLPQETIERIAAWIEAGAPYEDAPSVATDSSGAKLFSENVRPLFESTCLKCHSKDAKASGLELTSRVSLLRGGDHGPAIVPGDARSSLLYKAVAHLAEPHMPFRSERLPQQTIDQIGKWIDAGAPYTEPLKAQDAEPLKSDHWAFKAPVRPAIPKVGNQAWAAHPIDAFVAAEQKKRGLEPVGPAKKRVLLRRVYLDLIGLPPTREEVQAFLEDTSEDAYEKVVERLLASPRYGERWGRHWMDIWRYSDWYGWRAQNQVRYSHRHVWRWRDWIVESLNEDKGYDQMIREMLAGDEIAPSDPDTVRATGYLARSWYRFNRNVWLQDTVEYTSTAFLGVTLKCARCHDHKYDPILQTDYYRFRAFFEPHEIRVDRVRGEPDTEENGLARAFDADAGAQTYRFMRGNEANPDEENPLSPGLPRLFGTGGLEIKPVSLPLQVYYPDSRSFVHEDLLAQAKAEIENAEKTLIEAKEELLAAKKQLTELSSSTQLAEARGNRSVEPQEEATKPLSEAEALAALSKAEGAVTLAEKRLAAKRAQLPALEARIVADKAKYGLTPDADPEALTEEALKVEREARMLKAEADLLDARQQLTEAQSLPEMKEGDEEEKKKAAEEKKKKVADARKQLQAALDALAGPTETYTPVGEDYPQTSTGRRLALARWIASRDNPLTARVAVNHMWLRHFGQALVPTVFNFGSSGKPPSHPELLDWLSMELMQNNWSMKHLHRLMVTSKTYRLASMAKSDHPNTKVDPENVYLWRMNTRRMEAELVRDSLLHVTGQLDNEMGGPEIDETKGQDSRRRSVYFRHTPESQMVFLKLFDAASPVECFQRNESVTPHQALALSNSKLSFTMSRLLARQLNEEVGESLPSNGKFIEQAFEVTLGRPPSAEERAESENYLSEQANLYAAAAHLKPFDTGAANEEVPPAKEPHLRARESLMHVLFNHNEFVTIR